MAKIAALLLAALLLSAARVTVLAGPRPSRPSEEDWIDAIERRALARVGSRGVAQ